jgi:hypothetical protein
MNLGRFAYGLVRKGPVCSPYLLSWLSAAMGVAPAGGGFYRLRLGASHLWDNAPA